MTLKKKLGFIITAVLTVTNMSAKNNIPAIDVHSHIVTDEYLKYLADNDALMADGYPLPSWDEQSHLAFMQCDDTLPQY